MPGHARDVEPRSRKLWPSSWLEDGHNPIADDVSRVGPRSAAANDLRCSDDRVRVDPDGVVDRGRMSRRWTRVAVPLGPRIHAARPSRTWASDAGGGKRRAATSGSRHPPSVQARRGPRRAGPAKQLRQVSVNRSGGHLHRSRVCQMKIRPGQAAAIARFEGIKANSAADLLCGVPRRCPGTVLSVVKIRRWLTTNRSQNLRAAIPGRDKDIASSVPRGNPSGSSRSSRRSAPDRVRSSLANANPAHPESRP